MFNWIDLILLLMILGAALIGYKRGFIKTLFKLISFFVAIFLAIILYKPVAVYLTENTGIKSWIEINIGQEVGNQIENIEEQQIEDNTNTETKEINVEFIDNLPNQVKNFLGLDELKNQAKATIVEKVTTVVINIISILLIFVISNAILAILTLLLNGIFELPILKQINQILGLGLGTILGFLQIYILLQ